MNCGLGEGTGNRSEDREAVNYEGNHLIKRCSLTTCMASCGKGGEWGGWQSLSTWYFVQSPKGTPSMIHFTSFFGKTIKIYWLHKNKTLYQQRLKIINKPHLQSLRYSVLVWCIHSSHDSKCFQIQVSIKTVFMTTK